MLGLAPAGLQASRSHDTDDAFAVAELLEAADAGNIAGVKERLEASTSPDATTKFSSTALILAAAAGHVEVVDLLLDHGAAVDKTDRAGRTALLRSISRGHTLVAARLIGAGASPDIRTARGATPLHAASAGRRDLLSMVITESDERNPRDNAGRTPLHIAVKRRRTENVKLLIDSGAEPNISDAWGYTPLMLAAGMKTHRLIATLLEGGASPGAADIEDLTALDHALAVGDVKAFDALLEACLTMRPDDRCRRFVPVSQLLSITDYGEDLYRLVQEELRSGDYQPAPLLHVAVSLGRHDLALALLAAGVDPGVRDREGMTALHWAAQRSRSQIAYHLIRSGADLNAQISGSGRRLGWTPLMIASSAGDEAMVDLLIGKGADVEARNVSGRTALFFAAMHDGDRIAGRLVAAGARVGATDTLSLDPYSIRQTLRPAEARDRGRGVD